MIFNIYSSLFLIPLNLKYKIFVMSLASFVYKFVPPYFLNISVIQLSIIIAIDTYEITV